MSIYKVQSGESLSTIAAANGISVKELQEANGISDPKKLQIGQELRIPEKTPQAQATEMKLEDAKHQVEILTAQKNKPSLPPIMKEAMQKQIDNLKDVYKNSSYNISPDGSVEFEIKSDMNVEDFKKAYNIKDGVFRDYLYRKHEDYMLNDPTAHYFTIGSSDDNTEAQDIDDFENKRPGSFREYGDGYKIVTKERFWQPNYHQIDYSGMDLNKGETFKIPGSAIK